MSITGILYDVIIYYGNKLLLTAWQLLLCFVSGESCHALGIINRLASKLSTKFICLHRFCCRWAPLINNYKYLTALHCLAPLWLNSQECKTETIKHTAVNDESICVHCGTSEKAALRKHCYCEAALKRCALLKQTATVGEWAHSPAPLFSTRWHCTLYNLFHKLYWTQR